MEFNQFKDKFEIHLSEPKTVNSGTQRVMHNVISIFLVDKETGTLVPTKLCINEFDTGKNLLLQIFESEFNRTSIDN